MRLPDTTIMMWGFVEMYSRQPVQEDHRACEGILKIHLEYSVACSTCSPREVGCAQLERGVTRK
jgi:hypothetical protein